jgi:L-ascorbate metabolism protein UlaG (beta-lactamase superfamily)
MNNSTVRISRLSWAGIQIRYGASTIAIDLLENLEALRSLVGAPRGEAVPSADQLDAALVTHLHADHYDPLTLRRRLRADADVLCHVANEATIKGDGFHASAAVIDQPTKVGPFSVTALSAVGGLGEPQVSYMVEFDGLKVLHCGDTLWHGNWWKIRERFGSVDIAFLPINGVTIEFPGMKPSGVPVDLTPAQAAAAGDILEAKTVCPIHYKLWNNPPVYSEWPDAEKVFLAAAAKRGVNVQIVEPGEEVSIFAVQRLSS